MLQAHVAVKRIEDFLEEDEGESNPVTYLMKVPDWVCSLKSSPETQSAEKSRIGFANATFRWNTGKKANDKDTAPAKTGVGASSDTSNNVPAVEESPVFNLSNLTVDFPVGKLSVITGPTGSGKTAILTALLGEMDLLEGSSYLPKDMLSVDNETALRNTIAYASQTPWLQQKSIKDNILFGEKFDEERYDAALDACAL